MYLQSKALRVKRSPSPLATSSTESDRELMKTPSRKSTPRTPRSKSKSTPIRKPRVKTLHVDRDLRRYLEERDSRPAPSATVSVPPRDSVSTFIQDLETNIRSKVKPTFHDDLFHEINTTVLSYKKKQHQQPRIINLQDIPDYNPGVEYHITQQQPLTTVQLIPNAQPPALLPQATLQPPPLQQQIQQQIQQQPPVLQPQGTTSTTRYTSTRYTSRSPLQ